MCIRDSVYTVRPDSPRALSAEALAALAKRHFPQVTACASVEQALPGASETLRLEKGPGYEPQMNYAEEEAGFEKVMDLIKAVRTLRADMGCLLYTSRCV